MSVDPAGLHGDMNARVSVDTESLEWQPSPSGSVLRKRLHRVGPAESGQVTSLVRYLPGASFPEHPHPEGEEIYVLEGTFSDQNGHAHAGTHLLNPEGYRHAPYSEAGCLIFVKLRQYDGVGREHHWTVSDAIDWQPGDEPGIDRKRLYEAEGFPDRVWLERWAPEARIGPRVFPDGAEILVIEGEYEDAEGRHGRLSWLRLPPGDSLEATSQEGCTIYLKTGGVRALRSISVIETHPA